jgi:hypothetical protein
LVPGSAIPPTATDPLGACLRLQTDQLPERSGFEFPTDGLDESSDHRVDRDRHEIGFAATVNRRDGDKYDQIVIAYCKSNQPQIAVAGSGIVLNVLANYDGSTSLGSIRSILDLVAVSFPPVEE